MKKEPSRTQSSIQGGLVAAVLLMLSGALSWGQTAQSLPYSFTSGRASMTSANGWTYTGIGTDYSDTTTTIKFDDTGDVATLLIASAPNQLTYYLKGNSFSGGTFTISESANGTTFTTVRTVTTLTSGNVQYTDTLLSTTRYIRWAYTTKSAGNVGMGTIAISAAAGTAPPTLTAAGSATVDAAFNVTFTDDSTWRAAISSITVGGNTLTAGYSVSAGQITFTPSASAPTTLLQTSGTKSIVVKATGYSDATVSQTVGAGMATKLVFSTVPSAVSVGVAFSATVQAQDQYGNLATGSSASVTVSKASGAGTLTGGAAQNLVSGAKTFSSLSYDTVETFTIQATASGLATATSGNITASVPTFTWTGANGTWLTSGNWSPSGPAGSSSPGNVDLAVFDSGGTHGTVGINMNSQGGSHYLGEIRLTGGTALTINNSSTTVAGTLTLNGSSGFALENSSAVSLTLANGSSRNMDVAFGNAGLKIEITSSGGITISSAIKGNNGFTKTGNGSGLLTLSGVNTYSGDTTISAGTLKLSASGSIGSSPTISVASSATFDVSGVTGQPGTAYSLASGQALMGYGTVHGKLAIASGSTLAPGASIGTIYFDTAPTLSGTTSMEIDKTAGTTDKLHVNTGGGTLIYGGTLSITWLTGSAAAGDAYVLFEGASDGAPKFSGSFSSISPSTPGTGLAWDTSTLASDGTLRVTCVVPTTAAVGANQEVCGLTSGGLGGNTPTLGTGTWTKSSGPGNVAFNPSDTTPNATATADAYGTYVLRWTIHNPACTDNSLDSSADVTVICDPASVGGTASAGTSLICGSGSTTLTLSGYTGSIQWQQSADGTTGWASVTGGSGDTTATYTTPTLTTTTYYRAVVTSGVCSSANSTVASVTINSVPAVTVNPASQTACNGSAATLFTVASGGNLSYAWRKAGWGTGNQWQLSSSGSSGFFVGDSTKNGGGAASVNPPDDINTAGKAWGLWANSGGVASAMRAFGSGMSVGQTFKIDMDNGWIDNGNTVGFGLRNSSGENVWEFYFTGGNANYTISAGSVSPTPNLAFTTNGLHLELTLTSASTYSVVVTPNGGTASTFTGSLLNPGGGQTISQMRLFNANAGSGSSNDAFFNSVSVGPYSDNAANYTGWSNGDNLGNETLANGGTISGADTSSLTINPVASGDAGNYDVVIWNSCGQTVSSAATLTVNPIVATTWGPGGSTTVTLNDATGTPPTGWNQVLAGCDLVVTALSDQGPSQKYTINVSSPGGGTLHFSSGTQYQWPIAVAAGMVRGFNPSKFVVNSSGFLPANPSGTFSVVLNGSSVVLVYAPNAAPCADVTEPPSWTPIAGIMYMYFANAGGLASAQALKTENAEIYERVEYYTTGNGETGTTIPGVVSLTSRTPLGYDNAGTWVYPKRLTLKARKLDSGAPAVVNALVMDTCGRGKAFDPVITTLEVLSGNLVQQQFDGLMGAEKYLRVVNGSPGLKWLEVNLNGRVFRVDGLANGQVVEADLGHAMREGTDNTVVLTGYGDLGSSALVTITDTPGNDLVTLPEIVILGLSHMPDGLRLTWPDTLAGWQLQSSANPGGDWVAVSATPTIQDGKFSLTIPTSGTAQFYRLQGPIARVANRTTTSYNSTPSETATPLKRTYEGILW